MKTRKEFLKFLGLGIIGFVATMSTEVAAQSKKTVDKKVAKKDEAKTTQHSLIQWTGSTIKINKRQCATCQHWKAEWEGCPCRKYHPPSMSVKTAVVKGKTNKFPCAIKNSRGSGSGMPSVGSCSNWEKWVDLP